MKKALLFLMIIGLCGCKDINDVRPDSESNSEAPEAAPPVVDSKPKMEPAPVKEVASAPPSAPATGQPSVTTTAPKGTYSFPFNRVITDAKNRSIDAELLAKQGTRIAFRKQGGAQYFIVSTSIFSPEDKDFLNGLPEGGNFTEIEQMIEKKKRFAGRIARWNKTISSAETESNRLKTPVLVFMYVFGKGRSDEIQEIFDEEAFKLWANENVTLLKLEVDDPKSKVSSGLASAANSREAGKLGIVSLRHAVVMLVRDGKKFVISDSKLTTARKTIMEMETILKSDAGWLNVYAVER